MLRPRTKSLFVSALLFGMLASTPAMAATYGFRLSINDPVFNSANGNNNVPDFELENISDPGSGRQITDFTLTIGDTSFNFDFVRIEAIFRDPLGDLNSTLNTVGRTNDHVGEDVLDYDFTGFDPGDIFRFEVDVDPDSGSPSQDFRNVLFQGGIASVTFSDGIIASEALSPANSGASSFGFTPTGTAPVPLPGGIALYLGIGAAFGIAGAVARRRPA